MALKASHRNRARESRSAIERLYIAMRHLFIRGSYKPLGTSGESMIEALRKLRPEIYGSITDPERVELNGLFYVMQRLPKGIEQCRYIKLISREGFEKSHFEPIIASKRRRNSYRIDEEQFFIEMTRGRSDIYDILTHLTFLYIEAEKIRMNSEDSKGQKRREWQMLAKVVEREQAGEEYSSEVAYTYLSTLLGRTYDETVKACSRFSNASDVNSIFQITYWLGLRSTEEAQEGKDREISFSSALREKVGHHHYGEAWAHHIKQHLRAQNLIHRPIHIISANLHSVMNTLYAEAAIAKQVKVEDWETLALELSKDEDQDLRDQVVTFAERHGMYQLDDASGMNISVQIFDLEQLGDTNFFEANGMQLPGDPAETPVIIVMDYAFGEQAFETLDELLKPFENGEGEEPLRIDSISIMGKAGILEGGKGDIMVPNAHVFEGTADNYPFENDLKVEDFEGNGLQVFEGPMITVLGTSLQNREVLRYFLESSWQAVGLEMEGAHYQKAIQAASKIRKSIRGDVVLRYAYYASDNPLVTGHTLASGSLGADGVRPTYLITRKILERILA
ncbi:MAG: hypothetical protein AAF798_11280 [Bacteroidota bacterium]